VASMTTDDKKARRELISNLIASSTTGMVTISFTNPLDTLKCRWQVIGSAKYNNLRAFGSAILVDEGLWSGLWRPGLPPNIAAMGLSVGLRYGLYPSVREALGKLSNFTSPSPTDSTSKVGPTGMFVAGLLAGAGGYMCASPLLQIKTQMQAEVGLLGDDGLYKSGVRAGSPPTYRNTFHAFQVLTTSGAAPHASMVGVVSTLWRGAGVIVGRGALLSASQLMAYDFTKTKLKTQGIMRDGPYLHVVASLAAAVCCTTCSMPLDTIVTVYQSAHSLGGEHLKRYGHGPIRCAAVLLQESGPLALMRGWVPAFARLAPTCTFSFWLYEQLRYLVGIGYLD